MQDHKHRTERRTRRAQDRKRNHARPQKSDQLASVTWQAQCSSCHGTKGQGDGPQAMMVKPRDLTSREWQDSVSDQQIVMSIVQGKGKMPPFNLPRSTVDMLVKHVRSMRFQSRQERVAERAQKRAKRRRRSDKSRGLGAVSGRLPAVSKPLPAVVTPPSSALQ